jgi:uncharacterized protein YheU (UPF0270 family)
MAAALEPPGIWFWSPDRRVRVVTAFESFIHREGLDNFECEITIHNPSVAPITESLRGSIRHGTATVYQVLTLPVKTDTQVGLVSAPNRIVGNTSSK